MNTPYTFTATGATTYTWNGTTPGNTISLSAPSNTVYSVTGTNANNCVNTTTTAVTTMTLPVVTIAPTSATVCQLTATSFTASGGFSYLWSNASTGSVGIATPSANMV